MQKRGQVTLFIIIGLILLLSIGIVIYLTTTRVVRPIEEKIEVPADVKPVHDFITQCLYNTAKTGVNLLGMQGGYIFIPKKIANTPAAHIRLDTLGVFKIPHWYYEGEDRTPSIKFMQSELSRYVKDQLDLCISEFDAFGDQFIIEPQGEHVPVALITDADVLVKLKWPLQITAGGKTTSIQDYVAQLDVRLKEAWELADRTMKAENEHMLFENLTMNLLTGNDNTPTDGFVLDCGTKRWHLDDVTATFQNVLYYNIPNVRIENTAYPGFEESDRAYKRAQQAHEDIVEALTAGEDPEIPTDLPADTYQRFRQTFDVNNPPTDLTAGFDYLPQWGIQLNANPNDGGRLKSNTGRGARKYLGFICINQWHFNYDIIYPVRMTVKDSSAFGGEGFVFQFGFPVLINDNTPERIYFGITKFESAEYASEFCETFGSQSLDVRAVGLLPGYPIATELPDVKISYQCVEQFCILGTTQADAGHYRLRTLLPQGCGGAFITAEKEGYLAQTEQITADTMHILLPKLKKLTMDVVVHQYNSLSGTYSTTRALNRNEKVYISLSLVNGTFYQYKVIPSNETVIELVEGNNKYDIDLQYTLLDEPIGGYSAAGLHIDYVEFADADKIIFHVFEWVPHPGKDKTPLLTYLYEGGYQQDLRPAFE